MRCSGSRDSPGAGESRPTTGSPDACASCRSSTCRLAAPWPDRLGCRVRRDDHGLGAREGSKLAAFVDLDYAVLSGQTEAGLRLVLEHFLDDPAVRSIIVNFTACGVRVDLIAESLAKVLQDLGTARLKPMYLHFEGNRRVAARETLRRAGFAPCERLGDAVRAAAAVAREV